MLAIYYEDIRIADVRESGDKVELAYAPDWRDRRNAFPISLSMPLRAEPYGQDKILPWLANLLPESHLDAIGQRIGVSPQDILGILAAIGRDTAGALSIGRPRETGDDFRIVETDRDLERIINELPSKPFLVGEDGVSMSLAGAQEKLAVARIDGKIAIPLNGTASTHILKPDIKRLKGSVENEAYCLTLAQLTGIDAARATTGRAGARSYLLVERYDRLTTAEGIRRIHQEDLAQILGYFPRDKYEFDGLGRRTGPGLKQLFAAVKQHVSPGARLVLLDQLIFNLICCNSDAHAKNYSVLIGAAGSARVAPLYDVLCGQVWRQTTRTLSQKLGEKRVGADVHAADWRLLAKDVDLNPARTLERVAELCTSVQDHAEKARGLVAAMPVGAGDPLDQVCAEVSKRATRLKNQLVERPRKAPPKKARSTDELLKAGRPARQRLR